jgi:hypothetical protein
MMHSIDTAKIYGLECRVVRTGHMDGGFGTTHACFSTASVSRPSAGATAGLLSANCRHLADLP